MRKHPPIRKVKYTIHTSIHIPITNISALNPRGRDHLEGAARSLSTPKNFLYKTHEHILVKVKREF